MTRGAFGFVVAEQEKISYCHRDSYPAWHGVRTLQWLRSIDFGWAREAALATRVVAGETAEEEEEWYERLHDAQGDLGAMLEAGIILDASEFPLDSLFCEWAYIVDFDADRFEVYEGFQKDLPTAGRWAGKPTERSEYKAVQLVGSWPLDNLPTDEELIALDPFEKKVTS